MKHITLPIVALLFACAANAQIYQWKDEKGRTVISDTPPAGKLQPQRKIETGTSTLPAATPQKTLAERDLEFRKRQKETQEKVEKTKKEETTSADKKENCESSRRYLQALESGERISKRDDKGERYFLEDAQREQEVLKLRQQVQSNCQ